MELVKERNILIGTAVSAGVIVFAVCWFIAAMSDPCWVFGTNYLSDLGVSGYKWAHSFFNGGCLVAGVLFALCGGLIISSRKKKLDIFAGIFAVISGISISLIGIVTEDAGDPHVYIALTAFGFGFLSLALLSIIDHRDGLKILSWFTPIGIIIVILTYLFVDLSLLDGLVLDNASSMISPEVETVAVIVLLLLFMLQGMKFIYHGAEQRKVPGIADRHKMAFGFVALAGAVIFLAFWLFAMLSDASWEFGTDPAYLLGSSAVHEAQSFFVIACIGGGLLTIVYGIGAGMMRNGSLRSVSGAFAVLAGIVLTAIGIGAIAANETFMCAEVFALLFAAIAAILIMASDWTQKRMLTASFYLLKMVVCVAALLLVGYDGASSVFILAMFLVLAIEGFRLTVSE